MTDKTRALLGDHEAAKRLTEKGVLLGCPFCGGTVVVVGYDWCTNCFEAVCDARNGGCGASTGACRSIKEASLAWNTRANMLNAKNKEENT